MTGQSVRTVAASHLRAYPIGIPSLSPRVKSSKKPCRRMSSRFICQAGTEPIATSPAVSSVDHSAEAAAPAPIAPPAYAHYPYQQQPMLTPEAVQQAQADPRYYQHVQGRAPEQYYMAPPPGYYPYAPPPPREEAASSGAPWFLWVGVGMGAAFAFGKIQEMMKNPKTPQQMMTEMMMKQAMGAMGGGKPGASPFGAQPGMPPFGAQPGSPFGAPGSPFGAAGSPFGAAGSPFGAAPGYGAAAAGASPAVDVPAGAAQPAAEAGAQKTADKGSAASAKPAGLDVVEPVVKEPTSAASSSGSEGKPKPAFFTDVNVEQKAAKAAAASANIFEQQQQQQQQQQQAGGTDAAGADTMMNMMETMLRNPEMQKMLYPYLPEPMRNPSSIEWMLGNPEVKKQMAQMFEQQNMMSPQMMDMMKGMNFSQEKVNQQFDELGLKPEDVISKVMSNPELASGFSNPKVQAAIIDISQNPMNIVKYQSDPEIMTVLEKVTEVFKPNEPQR